MLINESKRYGRMKVKAIHLFVSLFAALLIFPVSASAQDHNVILPSREVTVKNALGEIEKQTNYKIAVNWKNLDAQKRIMYPASQLPVSDVLDKALAGSGCKWEIIGDQIAIVYDNSQKNEENYPVYSAMNRSSLPPQMEVVPDKWSSRQISSEQIARIRNGYWHANGEGTDSVGLAVLNFRVNSTILERDYMDNARTLDLIHRTFSNKDMLTAMDFITVTAAASPEGNTAANKKLAADRAMAVKSYIMWKYPFMNRENVFTFSIGEDWTGLRKMVADDWNVPYRADVLNILDSYYDSDAKRSQLKQLGGGTAYRYISQHMLPKLRGAAACMIYYKEDPKPTIITETRVDTVYIKEERIIEKMVEVPVAVESPKSDNPYYFAIKTNLLYDLALLPDLALEFSLPNRWSIEVGGQWSWWNTPTNHKNCWRFQIAGMEVRKWLGDKSRTPFSGHFLGLYGMAGTYDVRFGNKTGYLSDMSYSMGLSYGYGLPIGRSWNLEFGISLGYVGGKYKTYSRYNDQYEVHPKTGDDRLHYFGPTKAKISLVWLVGSGKNDNKGKRK
ncbi:DUF3575 domain-containing protein [Alistipes sp. OttesenSCG-928-B03]|nr:DUF3575 domain-containing protein [Alistipes sp. OttesenSCG-928-B03]